MTEARERATPTTKRDPHAEARAVRRVEEATEYGAPVQMAGRGPFPVGGQRFPGRGAGIQRAEDVLALQRTMGNRATQRALANGQMRHTHPPLVFPQAPAANAPGARAILQRVGDKDDEWDIGDSDTETDDDHFIYEGDTDDFETAPTSTSGSAPSTQSGTGARSRASGRRRAKAKVPSKTTDVKELVKREKQYKAVEHLKFEGAEFGDRLPPTGKPPKSGDRASKGKEALGFLATEVKEARGPILAVSKGHSYEEQENLDADIYGEQKSKTETEVASDETRLGFGIVSSHMGVGGSLLSMGSGIFALFELRKKLKHADASKKGKFKREFVVQAGKTTASTFESGARLISTPAGVVAANDSGKDLAAELSGSAGGVAGICTSVVSAIDTVMSAAKGFKAAIVAIRKKREGEKAGAETVTMATELLKAGKSFVMTANGAIVGISSILKAFETAAAFVQSVPFLGGALNIVAQVVDFVVQGIGVATDLIKMGRAKKYQQKLADIKPERSKTKYQKRRGRLAEYLQEVNVKRYKRAKLAILPKAASMVGSFTSTLGSILDIIGTATAGAMGGGLTVMLTGKIVNAVGAAVKMGAAAIMPLAFLIRSGKQWIRDTASMDPSEAGRRTKAKIGTAKALGKAFNVNMNKTTAYKEKQLNRNVRELMKEIRALKVIDDTADTKALEEEMAYYRTVYVMIKAAGSHPTDLAKAEDEAELATMLRTAMKNRDVGL